MIVRKNSDGSMLLLAQTDHSRLAGSFAAHWGNARFAPLQPYEPVARAAAFHDFGYLRYETFPGWDAETGETLTFREVPTDANRLAEYRWCFDWLLAPDPYAALLVSMHRTGLWRDRYGTIASAKPRVRRLEPEIEAFAQQLETERPGIVARHGWDEAQLWTNYRLLQVWDLMSLYFACQEPYEYAIEPVPASYADAAGAGVRLALHPAGDGTVVVDPYPFAGPLRIALPARRFAQTTFADRAAFREAYFRAPLELLEYELVPRG